jgi:hypothetical protein
VSLRPRRPTHPYPAHCGTSSAPPSGETPPAPMGPRRRKQKTPQGLGPRGAGKILKPPEPKMTGTLRGFPHLVKHNPSRKTRRGWGPPIRMRKNPSLVRLLKKVQMQGGVTHPPDGYPPRRETYLRVRRSAAGARGVPVRRMGHRRWAFIGSLLTARASGVPRPRPFSPLGRVPRVDFGRHGRARVVPSFRLTHSDRTGSVGLTRAHALAAVAVPGPTVPTIRDEVTNGAARQARLDRFRQVEE